MTQKRLRLYADPVYLRPGDGHVTMLNPFWGQASETPGSPLAGRFEAYTHQGKELFDLTSLEDSDAALLPSEWVPGGDYPRAWDLAERATAAGKPVLCFFNFDSTEPIPLPNSLIFRTSAFGSRRAPNEFGLAAWSEDFVAHYCDGEVPLRTYQRTPVVGYCGYSSVPAPSWRQRLKRQARRLLGAREQARAGGKAFEPRTVRGAALSHLARASGIRTNFVIRQSFWNGAFQSGAMDIATAMQSRQEYVQNIRDSDYVLCLRGAGNFSYRLYETLSMGRIPVFVDTDCLLPWDHLLDWRQYVVWVPAADLRHIGQAVAAFHAALTPDAFRERQLAARRFWEEWLCPLGFFSHLGDCVRTWHAARLPAG